MKMINIKDAVKNALLESTDSRDDDCVLFIVLCKNLGYTGIEKMTVNELFGHIIRGEIPTFECVSRSRRKAQEDYPELRGSLCARERRQKNEEKYRMFFMD